MIRAVRRLDLRLLFYAQIAQIPGKDWQYTRVEVMGWTSTEKLFILFEDGKYVVFSNTGEVLSQNKIFTESLSDIVTSANNSDDGFVAFTKNNKVYVLLQNVNRRIYVDCSGEAPVTTVYPDLPIVAGNRVECSCVFEARNNESGKVEFIVSCMDQSMYFIAEDSISEINIAVDARPVLNRRAAFRVRSPPSLHVHPMRMSRASPIRAGWTYSTGTSKTTSWGRTRTAAWRRAGSAGAATTAWCCTGAWWACWW